MSPFFSTRKALTDEDLNKACELYVRDRYVKLSEEAKKLIEDSGTLDYTRLAWERDYYRQELIALLQQVTTA